MMIKTFPELFGSYKVYDVVKKVLSRYMGEADVDKVIRELLGSDAKTDNFLRKLALILKRHVNVTKASTAIIDIKSQLKDLVDYKIEPESIVISKKGKQLLKVYIQNKTEVLMRVKLGIEQIDRKFTALLYEPVKNFGYTRLVKSQIIGPGKMGVFKFVIKADVFGIQDLYELKNNKELNVTLGLQAEVDGIDGIKTSVHKVPVKIVNVKV